ncbi:LOW QUALITY PROTEIN: DNA repair protein XRCC1-like [Apteryx mantelli]|uniref:LOW QUALITY PROTEIN: DNA repair protein XRCC1-like n=1 Tax=Apteryx mantelli TaxID=2696672 RepID=A0ABM4G761_9AVES
MPEIELQHVVSVSSSDPTHCAENLLRPESYRPWRGARAGEKQICVVLQFAREARVHRIEVGNEGSAFVEVLAGAAAAPGQDFEVLLPAAALLTPAESRAGAGLRRVRAFGPQALARAAAQRAWDRVKVVCSQPYCQSRPFGLSFVRFHSPPESEEPPPAPVTRLGPFTVREDDGGARRPGALFYRRGGPPSPPAAAPQDAAGPSYAVATLQATSGETPPTPARPPKAGPRRPGGPSAAAGPGVRAPSPPAATAAKRKPEAPEANGGSAAKKEAAGKGGGGGGTVPPPPPARTPGPPAAAAPRVLAGVVLVLSGFENPLRSRLRDAAVAMGARYRPDWTPDSTHLVCAFARTPKAARARALGGRLVSPAWIWDCQRQRRRLPCAPYLLDGSGSASSASDGEEPGEAPPPPRPRHARKSPPPAQPGPSGGPATPPCSDADDPPPERDGDESGDTDDELRRMVPAPPADDPYGGSTDENTDSDEPIPPLPDFFVDKTFFLYGDFAAPERRLLQRYVTAFGGALAPYMSEKVTHVVTAQDWDETFEEALDVNPSLSFVRPRWVLACGERLRLVPPQPFAVVPRA